MGAATNLMCFLSSACGPHTWRDARHARRPRLRAARRAHAPLARSSRHSRADVTETTTSNSPLHALQHEMPSFEKTLKEHHAAPLVHQRKRKVQINIGLTCNLACAHCHVQSSPARKESMPRSVAERIVEVTLRTEGISEVDITGGAPEMHAQFRYLVEQFRSRGHRVVDRCNLSILERLDGMAEFLAENGVSIVASLPCYSAKNVEQQRGRGVFDASVRVLRKLNSLGYGLEGSALELDLVYNPVGAFLPPPQEGLEADFKRELGDAFGVRFHRLLNITNMPIGAFAEQLQREQKLRPYVQLLADSFNPTTVPAVMCVDQVHVAWNGTLYDCDFNYALDMPIQLSAAERRGRAERQLLPDALTVFDVERWSELEERRIRTGLHCYGCTAGAGSSCGGALE